METAEPTEAIVLEDLGKPRLPLPLRLGNRLLAPFARTLVAFDAEETLAAAQKATGLEDFGANEFREPLRVFLRSVDEEADLHPLGRYLVRSLVVQLLSTRLRMEDLVRRHPEILHQPIESPIVVMGLPRTGTTLLHNLLSRHPDLRSLPYWESLEPLPLSRAAEPDHDVVERRKKSAQALSMLDWVMPHFSAMHEMEPDLPHEEIQLLAVEFSSMLFEASYDIPTYRRWYATADQRPAYRTMRRLLQILQWLRGGERWLLKSPQHLEQLPVLLEVFPDAKIIQTHRDPVSVVASMATMAIYTQRMSSRRIDPARLGRGWLDRIELMLHSVVRDRAALPDEQVLDVHFEDYMADNLGTAERALAFAGEPITPSARKEMERFLASSPRGKHGRIRYRFEDLGLTEDLVRERLAFYQQRFGVRDE